MQNNDKLTGLLKGKVLSGTSQSGGETTISFTDGATLTLQTAPSNSNNASTGGTVEAVHQSDDPPALVLKLSGGAMMEIPLASASGSVSLRDGDRESYSE